MINGYSLTTLDRKLGIREKEWWCGGRGEEKGTDERIGAVVAFRAPPFPPEIGAAHYFFPLVLGPAISS